MDIRTLVLAVGVLLAGVVLGYTLARRSVRAARPAVIETLVGSTHAAVQRMEAQLREIDREQAGSSGAVREQLAELHRTSTELSRQTAGLAGALRSPNVRGRWGEIQLQRIVELAGMAEHCDFETQVGVTDGLGTVTARPDLVVRLSGGRSIPVDAKVPFGAWLEAIEAGSGVETDRLLAAHARAMRSHVDSLASKAYWQHFQPAPEFVVLFVPGEPLLDAALQRDPQLTDYAFSRNVVLATPSTLITLLRTVAFAWRTERLGTTAAEIHALGRELYQRLGTLGDHLGKLGATLARSVEHYNGTIASLESRVLVTARKFSDLQGSPELAVVPQVEATARQVQAPELLGELRPRRGGAGQRPRSRGG